MSITAGVGLDVGTMNLVAARSADSKVSTSRLRNAFIDLPASNKRMLKISNTSYIEMDGHLLVIGDEALETANLFDREARQQMSGGFMSAAEIDGQRVIAVMLKHLLGSPATAGEKCVYSVPAPALDVNGSDITYHSKVLEKIIQELGFKAEAANEALAIIYSECAKSNFSGLGISFGSGMTNVCLAYNAMSVLEFSVGRGGDWIDNGASRAVGTTAAKICAIKESGLDLMAPKSRQEEALVVYIESLIDYVIDNTIKQFAKSKNQISISKPMPIVLSGGTSLAKGFIEKFQARFELYKDKFPLQVSEFRHASDPMAAVATGLLVLAQMDD